jgi:hypothetical protein
MDLFLPNIINHINGGIMKTKTISIIVLAMVFFFGTAKTFGQGLSLGAKAGIGFSYLSNFDDSFGTKRNTNMMALGGFIMNYKFGKVIGLQVELLYQQRGEVYRWDFEYGGNSTHYKGKIVINCLTLPVLLHASHSFGKINLFGGFGPYVGYAFSAKSKEIEPEKDEEKLEFGKDNLRRFDVGLSFDFGFGYKLGSGNLFLDLRYDLGFMDILYITDKPDGYKSMCNRNAGISLGYLIPIGKK